MTLYIDLKPTLEWVDSSDGNKAWADIYELQKLADGRFLLLIAEHCQDTYYKSMDEAKSAAQADYERRTAQRFVKVEVHTYLCRDCNGDGYTSEHDPHDPHIFGCSGSCPIQVQCEPCHGTGWINVVHIQSAIAKAREEP